MRACSCPWILGVLPLRGFGRWTQFVDSAELLRLTKRAFVDSFVEEVSGSDCGRCLRKLCNSVWNAVCGWGLVQVCKSVW